MLVNEALLDKHALTNLAGGSAGAPPGFSRLQLPQPEGKSGNACVFFVEDTYGARALGSRGMPDWRGSLAVLRGREGRSRAVLREREGGSRAVLRGREGEIESPAVLRGREGGRFPHGATREGEGELLDATREGGVGGPCVILQTNLAFPR